ncbi:MAG: GTPase HflX, partial [Gammaproteobacteria bacterium]|nr:GTPase HflX [Gammaproteobacteria bacterium]
IHVIDASDPAREDNAREVQAVLEALGAESVPQLRVYNKIDRRDLPPRLERDDDGHITGVWLSAATGEGLDLLRQAIAERVRADQARGVIELPATAGRLRAKFYELGDVLGEEITAEGRIRLAVELPRRELDRLYQHEGLNEELMPFAASGLPAEAAAL